MAACLFLTYYYCCCCCCLLLLLLLLLLLVLLLLLLLLPPPPPHHHHHHYNYYRSKDQVGSIERNNGDHVHLVELVRKKFPGREGGQERVSGILSTGSTRERVSRILSMGSTEIVGGILSMRERCKGMLSNGTTIEGPEDCHSALHTTAFQCASCATPEVRQRHVLPTKKSVASVPFT